MTAEGCGSLSPRRTGDADFPRPALLKTLASGLHTARFGRARQTNQSQPLKMRIPRRSFRRAKGSLTASLQMPDQAAAHEPIDFSVHACWVPEGEIVPIANIELNENMELACPPSSIPSGAQRTPRVGRRRVGSLQISSHTPSGESRN
jgi:hypothetical protein